MVQSPRQEQGRRRACKIGRFEHIHENVVHPGAVGQHQIREKFALDLTALSPGEHLLVIRAADSANNVGVAKVVLR